MAVVTWTENVETVSAELETARRLVASPWLELEDLARAGELVAHWARRKLALLDADALADVAADGEG